MQTTPEKNSPTQPSVPSTEQFRDPCAISANADRQGALDGAQVTAREIGGPAGPEPTRFGDWERKGRCIDF